MKFIIQHWFTLLVMLLLLITASNGYLSIRQVTSKDALYYKGMPFRVETYPRVPGFYAGHPMLVEITRCSYYRRPITYNYVRVIQDQEYRNFPGTNIVGTGVIDVTEFPDGCTTTLIPLGIPADLPSGTYRFLTVSSAKNPEGREVTPSWVSEWFTVERLD